MENKTQQGEEVNTANQMAPEEQPVNEAAAPESAENSQKDSELIKLQSQVNESKDKYLRLYSEFENFRRRTAKEKLEMIQSANEQLLKALLPVVDDFERAEKSFKEKNDKDSEGFALIYSKFKKTLDQFGVKVMDLQPGADFNADTQEAITQIPAPDPSLKGKVVDVVEKGYVLNDKVIRYAKVVVGN
jgi:molecular chaperone GrpE